MRLSIEDNDIIESESIGNQRELLTQYSEKAFNSSEYSLSEYIDDGFTGTNFNRPSVKRLLEDIKRNEIKCIIVKDFSRFGRSYIEVGDYLEQVFPFMGVRFISVNDGYDSLVNKGYEGGVDVFLKTLIAELYSRDLSIKIKTSNRIMQEKGLYGGNTVAYGYLAVSGKFVVNKECAEVVKIIFQMSIDGFGANKITKFLNENNYAPPKIYSLTKNLRNYDEKIFWLSYAVREILQNQTYIGDNVGRKYQKLAIGSTICKKYAPEDWIITKGTHESIIEEDVFYKVNSNKRKEKNKPRVKKDNVFAKIAKCKHCGRSLHLNKRKEKTLYCSSINFTVDKECKNILITVSELAEIVLQTINAQINLVYKNKKNRNFIDKNKVSQNSILKKINNLENKKVLLYESYKEKKISLDDYNLSKQSIMIELIELEILLNACSDQQNNEMNKDSITKTHLDYLNAETLTVEMLKTFVDTLVIGSANDIEIVLKYKDFYENI